MKRRELRLASDERAWLEHFTGSGSAHHQGFKRAQILLAADEPNRMSDAEIARAVGVSKATVYNVRSRYLALGVEATVERKARKDKGIREKVDTLSGTGGRVEAHLIALACSATPNEEPVWTLKMLADKLVELELKIIGLSDHAPLFAAKRDEAAPGMHMRKSEFGNYIAEANHLKEKYADYIEVLVGVEADFLPGTESIYAQALATHRLDYVLGSVHYFGGYHVYDPARWRTHPDVNKVYREYFKLVQAAATSGLFDVLAHIDAVKGLGHKPTEDLSDSIGETVQVIKDSGVAVEINTSGIRKVEESFPSLSFVQKLQQAGVPLTYGSDAHSVHEVGHGWEQVRLMLEEIGVEDLVVFRNRQADTIPLERNRKPIVIGR